MADDLSAAPSLQRNLRLYGWLKMFTKRVYLPLTTIYLVEVGHLSLSQIGLLVTAAAVASIASGIPTGYFADRVKRKTSLVVGALLLVLSALTYVLLPSFVGAILAVVVESLGFSFISGAGEALMHDTLVVMGKESSYVKIMGRAQSMGLVGNIILVGVVPLTYGIDKRLPFLCGAIAASLLAYLSASLVEPGRVKPAHLSGNIYVGLVRSLRTFINRRSIWIFVAIGLMSAFYGAYGNIVPLVYKDLGINVSLIGLIYSASSAVGAIGGWYVHHLKRIPLLGYALFDVFMGALTMVLIGLTRNLWVAIVMSLLNLGFWRLRGIIYQDNLLRLFGHGGSKATLISTLSFFDDINEIWLPLVFVGVITPLGFYSGFVLLGIGGFMALGSLMLVGARLLDKNSAP